MLFAGPSDVRSHYLRGSTVNHQMSLYKQAVFRPPQRPRSPTPALQPCSCYSFSQNLCSGQTALLSPTQGFASRPCSLSRYTPLLLWFLPMFAKAAISDCHKLGDLKQQSFIPSRVWRPGTQTPRYGQASPSSGSSGKDPFLTSSRD